MALVLLAVSIMVLCLIVLVNMIMAYVMWRNHAKVHELMDHVHHDFRNGLK